MVIKEEKIIKPWLENWHIPKAVTSSFPSLQLENQLNCGMQVCLDTNDMRKMRTKFIGKYVLQKRTQINGEVS